jgi:hypothetical protein
VNKKRKINNLKAFTVNNGWTCFIVFLFGDPHSLKGGEGSKDGSSDPDRVFTFWWGDDLDLHGGWGKSGDFFLHAISNTWVHGGTTGEYVVGVEVLADIDIALHDGVVSGFVNTGGFHTNEGWLEEGFWATESFVTDGDNLSIGKFIRFLEGGGRSGGGHFLFEVEGDIAEFFLDVTDDFTFGGGDERVTTFGEDFHEVVGQIATGKIETHDSVWEGITFEYWDVVGYTITRVEYNTGGTSGGVEGEYGLDSDAFFSLFLFLSSSRAFFRSSSLFLRVSLRCSRSCLFLSAFSFMYSKRGVIFSLPFSSFSLASISSKHCCIVRVDLAGFCNASINFMKSESSLIVPFLASFRERDFFGIF